MIMYTQCVMFSGQGPVAMMMYTWWVIFIGQGPIAMMMYTVCVCDVQWTGANSHDDVLMVCDVQ